MSSVPYGHALVRSLEGLQLDPNATHVLDRLIVNDQSSLLLIEHSMEDLVQDHLTQPGRRKDPASQRSKFAGMTAEMTVLTWIRRSIRVARPPVPHERDRRPNTVPTP